MIPLKLRIQLSCDKWYKRCCLTGWDDLIIEFHHCYLYSRRSIQERWNIIPVVKILHRDKNNGGLSNSIAECKRTKDLACWIAINRADIDELKIKYPKFDWQFEKNRLNEKFGDYNKYEFREINSKEFDSSFK